MRTSSSCASLFCLRSAFWLLFLITVNSGCESFLVTAGRAPWSKRGTDRGVPERKDMEDSVRDETFDALVGSPPEYDRISKQLNRHKIQVSSEINLPFSSCVAFDAFADLRRQPTFSSWIKRVEYLGGSQTNSVGTKSKWTIAVFGFRFSWKAISLRQDREAGVIQWGSLSGLKNQGCVQFSPLDTGNTHMKLTMTIFVPRFAARVMGEGKSNSTVARMIENRMLKRTLETFREDVLQNDLRNPFVELLGAESQLGEEYCEMDERSNEIYHVDDYAEGGFASDRGALFRPVVPQE